MIGQTVGHRGQIAYWVTTLVAAVAFSIPGIANLAQVPHIEHDMTHLGYPRYFMTILGVWKLLGAIVILAPRLPRLKEWAYAGMIFDLTGAAASRAAMLDSAATIAIPLLIGFVVVASWALRPGDRTLRPFLRETNPP